MAISCCVVTPASHVSLPFCISLLLLTFTHFCQAVSVLPPLWWAQQNNVNALSQQIARLEQQINDPKLAIAPRDRLALEKDLTSLEKDRVSLQNGIYTTLVQALGGAFFFVTAYLT